MSLGPKFPANRKVKHPDNNTDSKLDRIVDLQ